MGYSTEFTGQYVIDPPLTIEQATYINKFSRTKRMRRDAFKAVLLEDTTRHAILELRNNIGPEGGYFTGGEGFCGQTDDNSVIDHNRPPQGQPGLWCQWAVVQDGSRLEWDEGEKFYCYSEWLEYLIEHFFSRWGRTLNGEIYFSGEDYSDFGIIFVKDNKVSRQCGGRIMPENPFK